MARRLVRRAASSPAGERLLAALERAEPARPGLLRVLTYHRVSDAAAFRAHMAHVAASGTVVSAAALLEALAGGAPLPPRALMITFDDGYREVGDVAWPILRGLGLPAVLFVPTAYPGAATTFWWDRLEQALADTPRRDRLATPIGPVSLAHAPLRATAAADLRRHLATLHHDEARRCAEALCADLDAPPGALPAILGWDDLRRLAREGLAVGAHSRTHPILTRVPHADLAGEVAGARDDLRRELGSDVPIFCYPNGRHDPAVRAALRNAGYAAAFTTRRGTNDLRRADPLRLRRINVARGDGLPDLRARLVLSSARLNRWRWLFDPQRHLRGEDRLAAP
jgi:peptidoglycan/xylan/chitin deacetylase (PgdA/CDA1 family)